MKLAKIKLSGITISEANYSSLNDFMDTLKSDGATVTVKFLRKGLIHIKASSPKKVANGKVKKRRKKPQDSKGPDVTASLLPQLFNL